MLKEMKRQFGFLLFGVPKKKKQQTRIYHYNGRPVVSITGDRVTYHTNHKKKPRR
jgi:hypothetical protein